jgi:hypothetical protein
MEVNVIRETMHAQPFQPFRLRLADGRELMLIVSLETTASGSGKQSGNSPPSGPANTPA